MSERFATEIAERLRAAGAPESLLEPLATFGERLLSANQRFNLTGAKTARELVPHLLDSLAVVPYVRGHLVDVGSGGGLPAIVIAIACGRPVLMIEAIAKKADFLRSAVAELGIPGEVIGGRAEVIAHDPAYRERFDSATARAVSTAPTVAELLLPFLALGGRAVLQRGSFEDREREALTDAVLMLGGRVEDEIPVEDGRRIVIVEKTGSTNQRFPRRAGIPHKRPLCLD